MRDPTPEHMEWIANLKQGDIVDALKLEQNHRKICWSRAKVATVLENHLKIVFLNEKETFNRYFLMVSLALS